MHIAAAGNTEAPAYLVLVSKGFDVQRHHAGEPDAETWIATKGTLSLQADGLLELLGLIALHDARGDDWPASDAELDSFFRRFGL